MKFIAVFEMKFYISLGDVVSKYKLGKLLRDKRAKGINNKINNEKYKLKN